MAAPPNSIPCILCGGLFLFPGPRFAAHLQNEHGVMYDLDFLVKVSQHKKYFSKLPPIPSPNRFLESSSQTWTATGNGQLCRICSSKKPGTGKEVATEGVGEWYQGENMKYEVSETVVVKPEIIKSGSSSFSCIGDTQFTEPLASGMHCYFNCGAVFRKGYDLQLHIKLRHKGEDSKEIARAEEAAKFEIALTKRSACQYKCALCNKTVEGWSSFWEHLRKHKISVADYKAKYGSCEVKTVKFQCRICEKVMKHESNIVHKHLQMVHGINWSQYLSRIRMEMRGIQQAPLPDLVKDHCKICGGTFKYIKDHLRNNHGISVEQYDQLIGEAGGVDFKVLDFNQNCRVQDKVSDSDSASLSAFSEASAKSSSGSLPKPSKTEMGNKAVKHCSACHIQFQERRQFIEHCQNVHNIRFKTKASQGICKGVLGDQQGEKHDLKNVILSGRTIPGSGSLQKPQTGKVARIVWPQKRDTLVCKNCGEKFPSWKHLDQHMKLVCKKVRCEFCGKTYSNLFHLTKHRKTSCPKNMRTPCSTKIAREIVDQIVGTVLSVSHGPKVVLDCTVSGCGQQFGREVHLRRHLVNYHNH